MPAPIPFKESNSLLKAPPGSKGVDDLPVFSGPSVHNQPTVISKWRLTIPELKKIAEHGEIWLCFIGCHTHPPVALMVDSPFVAVEREGLCPECPECKVACGKVGEVWKCPNCGSVYNV